VKLTQNATPIIGGGSNTTMVAPKVGINKPELTNNPVQPRFIPKRNIQATSTVVARDTLNTSATPNKDLVANLAAENSVLPVLYGNPLVGARIASILPLGTNWIFHVVWGHGECDSLVNLYIDDTTPPAGTVATHYMGTASQNIDATLQAAWGTSVTVVLLQEKGTAVSATNPLYTMTCLINNTTDINGGVGDLGTQDVTWTVNGAVAVATTGTF